MPGIKRSIRLIKAWPIWKTKPARAGQGYGQIQIQLRPGRLEAMADRLIAQAATWPAPVVIMVTGKVPYSMPLAAKRTTVKIARFYFIAKYRLLIMDIDHAKFANHRQGQLVRILKRKVYELWRKKALMTLTKAQIVEIIAEQNGFAKNKSVQIVEHLLEIIKRSLESGDDVLISGFGKFCVKTKGQRRGRNPATGSDLMLSARKVVTFKCSGKLREKING